MPQKTRKQLLRRSSKKPSIRNQNTLARKVHMTNRLLGLPAYRTESTQYQLKRIAQHVQQHDTSTTLKASSHRQLSEMGHSVVNMVTGALQSDSHHQAGGGAYYHGLQDKRQNCISHLENWY
jgi:hypothetical protein